MQKKKLQNYIVKVGIDFDGTLEYEDVQKFFSSIKNIDIHIVTSRIKNNIFARNYNKDIYSVAAKLNISENKIIFLELSEKYTFYKNNNDFLFHLDDIIFEVDDINEYTDVKGIFYNKSFKEEYKKKVLELIYNKNIDSDDNKI